MKVLSLFDGISCGMVALERAGIPVERYVAYENNKYPIEISTKNYPFIEQKGDVFEGDYKKYKGFDLLIGGSPCTHWSIANKNRETEPDGLGYKLFMQYVRALREAKPRFFLYENNYSISKEIKKAITDQLGVEPIMIDSALVSAQQRKRYYWTNIPNVKQPCDKKIYLKDVLEIRNNEKSYDKILMSKSDFKVKVRKHYIDKKQLAFFLREKKVSSGLSNKDISEKCNVPLTKVEHWFRTDGSFSIPDEESWWVLKDILHISEDIYDKQVTEFEIKNNNYDMAKRIYNINGKHPTLTTLTGGGQRKTITDGIDLFYLTPLHCERLQTLPDRYTEGVSANQRFKAIGNGWTVDVIAHIFSFLKEMEKEEMELRIEKITFPEVIDFNFEELKQEITNRVAMYTNMVYTEDQVKQAKADRANLNKFVNALSDERIKVKKQCLKPYEEFEAKVNELSKIVQEPIKMIDMQVKEYEEQKKQEKLDAITNFFNSTDHPEWLHIAQIMNEKWLNASVSMKSIQEEINLRLELIKNDVATLSNLPEFGFEATEVYKNTLDINKALNEGHRLSEIQKRKAEHEAEQARLKAEAELKKAEPQPQPAQEGFMNPPVEEVKKYAYSFRAFMTIEEAKELRKFFEDRNIQFEAN